MSSPFRSAVVRCRAPQGCPGVQLLRADPGAMAGRLAAIGWSQDAEHGWTCPRHGSTPGAAARVGPLLNPRTLRLIAAIRDGHDFGLAIARTTGLSESTVYATLRRLRAAGWAVCEPEPALDAVRRQRPRRKIYRLTALLRDELGRAGAAPLPGTG